MATALEILLARLANERNAPLPAPAAPMNLGPLSNDTSLAFGAQNPEPVPPAFTPPAAPDMNFVNQYAGQAPTRPVLDDPSTLDKIAAVLGGIAGGPGYALALKEERQRPIREYEAQRGQYEERRTRGLELAERRSEREQERASRAAEAQYERDLKTWLKKHDVREGAAAQQAAQAFQLLRDARATAESERKERVLLRRQVALQMDDRIKAYRDQGADKYAEELARSDFRMALEQLGEKVPPLSAAASKANTLVQAKLQRALRLAQGGSGGGDGRLMAVLADGRSVPLSVVKDGAVTLNGESVKVVDYVGGGIPARPQGPQPMPGEAGGPQGPYVPPSALAPQASAPKPKMTRAQAKAKLVKAGYGSAQADRELDALGIQ